MKNFGSFLFVVAFIVTFLLIARPWKVRFTPPTKRWEVYYYDDCTNMGVWIPQVYDRYASKEEAQRVADMITNGEISVHYGRVIGYIREEHQIPVQTF